MRVSISAFWIVPSAVLWAAAAVGRADGLRNGSFKEVGADGGPAGWRVIDEGQRVQADTTVGVLQIDIARGRDNDGQMLQRITGLPPDRAYVLTGGVRSSRPGLAYLQVKLYRGGKEQRRLTAPKRSETEWREAELSFSTGDSDALEVLCRFRQREDAVGQTVWFRGISLGEAGAPSLLRGEAVPTFECIGIDVEYSGGLAGKTVCRVRYRAAGETAWREGMGLVPCLTDRRFRGSVVGLRPGTEYEIECQLEMGASGPASTHDPLRLSAKTWPEEVPVAEVRPLPAPDAHGMIRIDAQGKAEGWIAFRPLPVGPSHITAGAEADHVLLIEGAAFILIEGYELRGGRRDAVRIAKSDRVWIRHCDIAGWGDPGTPKQGLKSGLYVDARGHVINYQAGVRVCDGSTRTVVEHNFIHDPRGTANSWAYGHPEGPQGVLLDRTAGNHVVRFNDLVGNEAHWWNDAIESIANGEVTGGPYRDTDLYGNVLAFSNDDGTELDGGQINVRYWHNWIDRALCGISCAPNRSGPSYVFRNLVAMLGEEREKTGSAFKMGGGVKYSPGMNVVLHNTIYGPGGGLRSVGYGNASDRGGYVAFSRNNLFAGTGRGDVVNTSTDLRNDFDYDLVSRGGVSLAGGGESHAVTSTPVFADAAAGDYRLADGSPGIDRGCAVPGFQDALVGSEPDMGTFEAGAAGPDFPPRPHGMSVLPLRSAVTTPVAGRPSVAVLSVMVPPTAGTRWRAIPNSPWMTCAPEQGDADGKPVEVRVTLTADGRAAPRYRGAVTFRTDQGALRTVMIDTARP